MNKVIDQLATYTEHKNSQTEKAVYYKSIPKGTLENNGRLRGFFYITAIAVGTYGATFKLSLNGTVVASFSELNLSPKNSRIDFEIWNSNERNYQITSAVLTSDDKTRERGGPTTIESEEDDIEIKLSIENTTTTDNHVFQAAFIEHISQD